MVSGQIRTRQAARRRANRHRAIRRLGALAVLLAVALFLGLRSFDSGSGQPTTALANSPRVALAPDGVPRLENLASAPDGLQLEVPIRQGRITAIVYHGVGAGESIPLVPAGQQKNAGVLTQLGDLLTGGPSENGPSYYVDSSAPGNPTGSVDVGAVAGTGVYSPVNGRVVSIRPYVINGSVWGSVIQIQPISAPALIVTLTNVDGATNIVVGTSVTAAVTRLGAVADLSKAMSQDVAKFTSDAGNHVHIEVSQAPAATPIL